MNYEDEEYRRLYVRDTATWKMLGWEGQAVLMFMLRNGFDRSGVFDCGSHNLSHAVTAVTGLPNEVVAVGIRKLLELSCFTYKEGRLAWPRYVYAQTCRRSDRRRQLESRRNRSAGEHQQITSQPSHESPSVTTRHTPSRSVTQSRAEQSRNRAEEIPPVGPPASTAEDFELVSAVIPAPQAAPAKPTRPKQPLKWRRVPAEWAPNVEHREIARVGGLNFEREEQKFRDHEFSAPRSDPDATFRNWLRNAIDRHVPARNVTPFGRASPTAVRAGELIAQQDERVRQLREAGR